jgi:hypothetical protein
VPVVVLDVEVLVSPVLDVVVVLPPVDVELVVSSPQPSAVVPAIIAPNASIAERLIPRGASGNEGRSPESAAPQKGQSAEIVRTCRLQPGQGKRDVMRLPPGDEYPRTLHPL